VEAEANSEGYYLHLFCEKPIASTSLHQPLDLSFILTSGLMLVSFLEWG